jgi:cobalamin biosynthesis protein CbiD
VPGKNERIARMYGADEQTVRQSSEKDRQEVRARENWLTLAEIAVQGLATKLHYRQRGIAKTDGSPLVKTVKSMWGDISLLTKRDACARIWREVRTTGEIVEIIDKQGRDEARRRVRRAYERVRKNSPISEPAET